MFHRSCHLRTLIFQTWEQSKLQPFVVFSPSSVISTAVPTGAKSIGIVIATCGHETVIQEYSFTKARDCNTFPS